MPAACHPLLARALRRYFYSGWAFLIPYLAVYLLYYATKWPVNAAANAAADHGSEVIDSGPIRLPLTHYPVPCLLHIYWSLHVVHVILACVALWSWWTSNRSKTQLPITKYPESDGTPPDRSTSVLQPTADNLWPLAIRLAPWTLLALLFYIPGVYLEWPADPWEHLRRINEWRTLDTVGAHSSWAKSAYFTPYSLLSWCIGLRQLFWLDFYYTGICLLLCWQYYRFSRACGLGERASMVFVIIQALLFGNNIFSFYRYYGISSSIYAQLGAIALTRIVLEFAARGTKLDLVRLESLDEAHQCVDGEPRGIRQAARPELCVGLTERVPTGHDDNNSPSPSPITHRLSPNPATPLAHELSQPGPLNVKCSTLSVERSPVADLQYFSPEALKPYLLPLITAVTCLLALTAFNHPQGLGIAGLGIAAVIVWRLIERKRSALWWLIGGMIAINALFLALYPRPPIIETYRAQGWLTTWYGLKFFPSESPAFGRSLQIVSFFGLLDLALGLWLIVRKNHIAGWLTLMPLLALCLPCFALPLAYFVTADHHADDIFIFHRLLLAMPVALATVVKLSRPQPAPESSPLGYIYAFGALFLALTLSPGGPAYNRFWHGIQTNPKDLDLRAFVAARNRVQSASAKDIDTLVITPILDRQVQEAFAPQREWWPWRQVHAPPNVAKIERTLGWVQALPSLSLLPSTSSPGETLLMIPFQTPPAVIDLAAPGSAWVDDGGSRTEVFSSAKGQISSEPADAALRVFAQKRIRLDRGKRYQLAITIRQLGVPQAINYLAVAWLGEKENLLMANEPAPEGAGSPPGWNNGTYSYFGLVGQPAPGAWTTYSVSFGLGEPAEIPAQAAFLRVGALLNYHGTPHANIQLTRALFREIPLPERVVFFAPDLITPTSVAARLSGHWNPAKVHIDYAGTVELRTAISRRTRN